RRAAAGFAADVELAAVALRDVLDDRQAETGAARLARAAAVDAVEALGQARQGLAPDADAAVGDRQRPDAGGAHGPGAIGPAAVSRSLARWPMRSACCVISSSTRVRSASLSARFFIVSRKPTSTVSGVRISCEPLATKSRRIASERSCAVRSCDSTSFMSASK